MNEGMAFGPYTVLEPLGEGGFSRVYRARDRRRGHDVALKLLDPAVTATAEGQQRFLREVEAARRLTFRHVVPVYEANILAGRAYLALRLMRGGTLAQRLQRERVLDDATAAQVVRHTARALDYARGQGVVHRDVKPSNIFYQDGRVVCLGDFGLAKVRGLDTVTQLGQVIGSVYYMSPEQVRGLAHTTPLSDVYALGVVLYEMLTGRPPFMGLTPNVVLEAIVRDAPPTPRQFNGHISPAVETVILRALNKTPARRYATAGELAAAYQAALPGSARVVSPAPAPGRRPPAQKAQPGRPGQPGRPVRPAARPTPGRKAPPRRPTTERPEFWVAMLGLVGFILLLLYLAS